MFLLIIPFTLTSIILFFSLYFFKSNPAVITLTFLISISISFLLIRKNLKEEIKELKLNLLSKQNIPQIFLILVLIFLLARVLYPMTAVSKIDNFTLLQFNGLGDYYKHLYTMVPMIHDGIPPHHPYFPPETMSYYFGFYTIPVAFSIIFSLPPTTTLFVYVLAVYTLAFILLINLFNQYLKSWVSRFFSFLLLITGVGADVIPISAVMTKDPHNIIFNQTFLGGVGTQIINIYTTLLQSPQHFMAAVLTIVLLHHLLREKPKILLIVAVTTYVMLSSVFISISLILWLFLAFIFHKHLRIALLKSAVFCAIILIPYFLVLSNRQNILFFYFFKPYIFITGLNPVFLYIVNSLVTLFLQYGPILFLTPLIFLLRLFTKSTYQKFDYLILFIGLFLPFVLTWIIKSPDFNDFAMRTTIPTQMILPLIFIRFIETSSKTIRNFLILILLVTTIIGTFSFYIEYQKAWKGRKIIDPKTSQLILGIRKLPSSTKLAAIEKEDWVYYIPPLGFKQVLNPHLREASVSTTRKVGLDHSQYEIMAFNIFLNATTGENPPEVVSKRNIYFSQMNDYFQKYPFDLLLMDNQVWVKRGLNPYTQIFHQLNIDSIPITPNFTAFKSISLIEKLSSHKILVSDNSQTILVKDQKLPLDKGFWFLVSCQKPNQKEVHLELEDYYLIFNQKPIGKSDQCVGNVFYLPEKENLQLSNNSTVNEVIAYPVEIL